MSFENLAGSQDSGNAGPFCSLTGNWWLFVLRGALSLIFAVLAFWMPTGALLAFALVFGAFSLVDGVFGLISAVRNIRKDERWGWLAFSGVLGILAGIVVIVSPLVATLVIATFMWASVATWSIFTGVLEISAAVRLRKEIKGEFWLALSGALSVALGVFVFWMFLTRPVESFLAAGWLIGAYALFSGIILTMLGMKLRKWGKATESGCATSNQAVA